MSDKFRNGVVLVKFKKDLPYLKDGKKIEAAGIQFKSGVVEKLHYRTAGDLCNKGYCDILNENREAVIVSVPKKEEVKK